MLNIDSVKKASDEPEPNVYSKDPTKCMDNFPELFSKNATAPVFRSNFKHSNNPDDSIVDNPNQVKERDKGNKTHKDGHQLQNTQSESNKGIKGNFSNSVLNNVTGQDISKKNLDARKNHPIEHVSGDNINVNRDAGKLSKGDENDDKEECSDEEESSEEDEEDEESSEENGSKENVENIDQC